jgi:hypothetical protein
MKQAILFALTILLSGSAVANPFKVPRSSDNCGPRYERFRTHFNDSGLPEKFVQLLSNDAMEGFLAFAAEKMYPPVPTAEVKKLIEFAFALRANEQNGFVNIASCWYSLNGRDSFDFEDSKNMIKEFDSTLGTQVLDWIGNEWCSENWESIFLKIQAELKPRLPPFRPLTRCINYGK